MEVAFNALLSYAHYKVANWSCSCLSFIFTAFSKLIYLLTIKVEGLLISSLVVPTDAVVANSLIRGRFAEKHIPTHVKNILSAESGANDGLAMPYMLFSLMLMDKSLSIGSIFSMWITNVWMYHVLLSITLGFIIGQAARTLLHVAEEKEWIDKESFLAYSFCLTVRKVKH